jgi:Pyruvate/2-oxoacid:ferredoxin oxidoreductase gamma subunit
VCDYAVKPVTYALSGQPYETGGLIGYIKANTTGAVIIPGNPIVRRYAKMLNTALLGAAAQSEAFPFDTKYLIETISDMPKFRDENLAAFEMGRKLYNEAAG